MPKCAKVDLKLPRISTLFPGAPLDPTYKMYKKLSGQREGRSRKGKGSLAEWVLTWTSWTMPPFLWSVNYVNTCK